MTVAVEIEHCISMALEVDISKHIVVFAWDAVPI